MLNPPVPSPTSYRSAYPLTDDFARSFNDRWVAMRPDGSVPTDMVAFSEEFFREVYHRALTWRRRHPRALIDTQRAALKRIVHRAEVVFDVERSERPADTVALLLWDLRATLWRDDPAPL